jgi:iron(III) transport system permease protein
VSPWTTAALASAAVVAVPVIAVLASLATPRPDVWAHLWETQLGELVVNTLLLVLGVGAGTLVLGTALAWLVVGYHFPGRGVFEWALMLPLAMPPYVVGFTFLGLFDFPGPVQTTLRAWLGEGARLPALPAAWGVALVMTLVFYPYVYLLGRAAFREQGAATLETARSLGRSPLQAFLGVVLPMARPSLVAGVALAMMEALADFGTVATFGYRTLTEAIYRVWHGMFDRTAATQLASLLLLFALAVLVLERAARGRARFTQSQRRGPGVTPLRLTGWRGPAASAACALVLIVAVLIPIGQLLTWAFGAEAAWPGPTLARALRNTLLLAGAAALATGAVALALAYATRLHPTRVVRAAARLASMGYAVPGAVIAVGILVPLSWLDHVLAWAAERTLRHPAELLLTGSAAGLVFAYVVRFLAPSFQTLEASLAKIPPSLDEASRSLGLGVGPTLRRVHVPLLRRGLLTALILVLVDTMKELPATLLLRPLGLNTLAVEVWVRTSESMWAEAAGPALLIVAGGLCPVLLAIRFSAGERAGGRDARGGG